MSIPSRPPPPIRSVVCTGRNTLPYCPFYLSVPRTLARRYPTWSHTSWTTWVGYTSAPRSGRRSHSGLPRQLGPNSSWWMLSAWRWLLVESKKSGMRKSCWGTYTRWRGRGRCRVGVLEGGNRRPELACLEGANTQGARVRAGVRMWKLLLLGLLPVDHL